MPAPMWCYRDSLVVKQEAERSARAAQHRRSAEIRRQSRHDLLRPARRRRGVRHGHLGGGGGEAAAAAMTSPSRELRGMAMQGVVPPDQLSAIAMAKSMVSWHQRHGYCANCGTRTAMKEGGWKRECPSCKAEHFPRTDPVVIMLVTSGDKVPAGPAEAIPSRDVFVPCRLRRSRRNHRGRGPARDFRGIRDSLHRRELLHDAALALSVLADDRMHRARHQRGHRRRPHGTGGCALVRPRRGHADDQAAASRRPCRAASVCDRPSFARPLAAERPGQRA